jgi:hypothetical protein
MLEALSQGVNDIKKRVIGIENVVRVSTVREGDETTMLDRLQNIEMKVEQWFERVKGPGTAGNDMYFIRHETTINTGA